MTVQKFPNLGDHSDGTLFNDDSSDANKHDIFNRAAGLLDKCRNSVVNVIVSEGAGGVVTLTNDQYLGFGLVRLLPEQGSPGGPKDPFVLIVPTQKRVFAVENLTGQTCTVETGASPTGSQRILDGQTMLIQSNGEALYRLGQSGSTVIYDLGFYIPGVPPYDAVGGFHVAGRAFQLLAGAPQSRAHAETAPASGESDKIFDIRKNGASIGSATFTALSNTGSFSVSSDVQWNVGDRLTIVNPASPSPDIEETTLADVGIHLVLKLV